jgi:DNA-binding NarL/FixJ family response regulator
VVALPSRKTLSPSERRVLALVGQGLTDREIAKEIGVSVHTIRSQVRCSLHVLGARNRTHAAVLFDRNPYR